MRGKRITQKDVAEVAGVHRGTVSLAFKHHPSIPVQTRERILRIAEEMGYRPDPMLSALAAYRSNTRSLRPFQGSLAWLVICDEHGKSNWRNTGAYVQYYKGAKAQADKYGYKVEVFELDPRKMTHERMTSLLRARNVNGILLCPQPRAKMKLNLAWEHFSFITFGYTLMEPELHTVTATQYRSMIRTMEQMYQRGYRRIAFVVNYEFNKRTDHNFLAGYLSAQYQRGEPPTIVHSFWNDPESFKLELRQNRKSEERIDAVVAGGYLLLEKFREAGIRVPEDIPMACPLLESDDSELAGINEDSLHIGRVAVDRLVNMVRCGERGIPDKIERIHIEGRWIEGKTLPFKKKA